MSLSRTFEKAARPSAKRLILLFRPSTLRISLSDARILLPERHLEPATDASPGPPHRSRGRVAQRSPAELVRPADELPLDVGHHADGVEEVQRHVQLMIRVEAPAREDARCIRDRVVGHVGEQIRVIHHDVGGDRGIVHARVLVVDEQVVDERIRDPVVIDPRQPFGLGLPVHRVAFHPQVRELVVFLIEAEGEGLLVEPDVEEPLVVLEEEVAVGVVGRPRPATSGR